MTGRHGWCVLGVLVAVAVTGCCPAGTCKVIRAGALGGTLRQAFPGQAAEGELIVKLRSGAADPQRVMRAHAGMQAVSRAGSLLLVKVPTDGLTTQEERLGRVGTTLAALRAMPEVEYAQPNFIIQALEKTPDDTCWTEDRLWNYRLINLPSAWERGTGTTATTVAIVDTGLVPEHCDFCASNLVAGYNFVEGNANPSVDHGTYHGSHVAGTIGVVTTNNHDGLAGVNWQVGIEAVRVLNDFGSGTFFNVIQGIRWAAGLPVDGAPANPRPAKVISLSLGAAVKCGDAPALQEAITDAWKAGAVIVAAAGNSAQDAKDFSPAGCENVVAVAASGPEGNLAFYSNYGDTVKVLAPGGEMRNQPTDEKRGILSTVQGGYAYFQGTSMATPHVSGVFALVASRYPQLTPAQLVDKVLGALTPLRPGQCPRSCGKGFLNADVP